MALRIHFVLTDTSNSSCAETRNSHGKTQSRIIVIIVLPIFHPIHGAGGIASIGENKVDSKGHWILQQLMNVTYWTLRKGDNDPKTEHVGTFSDHVDPGSIIRSDNKSGGWIDHPGPNLKNGAGQTLVAHHSKWNFLIKAYNGNKECFVGFHAEMTFRDGLFSVHWGPGLY